MDLWMQLYVRKAISDWNYLKTTGIVLGLSALREFHSACIYWKLAGRMLPLSLYICWRNFKKESWSLVPLFHQIQKNLFE